MKNLSAMEALKEALEKLKAVANDRDDWRETARRTIADLECSQGDLADAMQQLKTMTEGRDEYRDRLLRNVEPKFFIIWNPSAHYPPGHRYETHKEAKEEAMRLATLSPDREFHVMAEAGHAISETVNWYCDQSQFGEEMPF